MGHDHEHNHSGSANKKTLIISLVIITAYMVIEVVGGLITNSLALLADAGHMLSDAISLFIALMAFTFSSKIADYSKTYGYKRFEILAAVINGATLILISVYIIYEAIERFQKPPDYFRRNANHRCYWSGRKCACSLDNDAWCRCQGKFEHERGISARDK